MTHGRWETAQIININIISMEENDIISMEENNIIKHNGKLVTGKAVPRAAVLVACLQSALVAAAHRACMSA